MIKKVWIIAAGLVVTAAMLSCGSNRNPGRAYMPDMTYSKAYETYAPVQERLNQSGAEGATFIGLPVAGTMARGEMLPYPFKHDSIGYVMSATVKSPLDAASVDLKEAERLYLVNCAICHGPKLDGDGPLWKDGSGPFPSAPKNFMADDMKAMSEGTMFHSVTYGKNMMGSYASQLNTKQRWMVIAYIKSKQSSGNAATDSSAAAKPATAAKDSSAAVAKK